MDNRIKEIAVFFDRYREIFNSALQEEGADPGPTAALFASCFIAANPSGVACGHNDPSFLTAMQQGYAFYKEIGITSMDIVARRIIMLDDIHTMTRVRWKSNFINEEGLAGSIEFENIYFTQTRDHEHRVFAYITGDEQAALKEAGLI